MVVLIRLQEEIMMINLTGKIVFVKTQKELKKYREIGTIEECQVAMEKFIEEAQLHEALRVLDERM